MSSAERDIANDTAEMDKIVRALQANWPMLVTLTASGNGLSPSSPDLENFLSAIQLLSDDGFISYEAVVIGTGGPRLIDAGLTARGRAHFGMLPLRAVSPVTP
jgi:hypothetical protein